MTGCSICSLGCLNCYAKKIAEQLQRNGNIAYKNGFDVTLRPERLNDPNDVKEPNTIFVCSMSDLFHKDVPFEFIDKVMGSTRRYAQHTYLLLTKRPERMAEYFSDRQVPANV